MKFCVAFLSFLVISFFSFSQSIPKNPNVTDAKGFRQGKWTLLFDANWSPVSAYDSAINYRLIAYSNDKPVGLVRDFYHSGRIQWEGKLLADRPQEIFHGEVVWYREDGSKEMVKYFENGKELKVVYYNPDGTTTKENWLVLNEKGIKEYNEGNVHASLATFELARVQAEKEFGKTHFNYSSTLNNLAFLYDNLGDYVKAEPLFIESASITELVVGNEHPEYALALNNLAFLYMNMGNYQKAEDIFLESLAIRKKALGANHSDYAQSLNNLAMLYSKQGKDINAIAMYEEVRDIILKTLGPDHSNHASVLNNLSVAYYDRGDYDKAISLSQEALTLRKKIDGVEHPDYAQSLYILAFLYSNAGMYTKAEPLYEEARMILDKRVGRDHPQYAHALDNLAALYIKTGFYDRAKPMLLEALKIREKTIGKNHFEYAITLSNLADLDVKLGLFSEAESLYTQSMIIVRDSYGENHASFQSVLNNLAMLYDKMKNYPKAEQLYIQSLSGRRQTGNKIDYSASLHNLAYSYYVQGKLKKADSLYTESIQILYSESKKTNPKYFVFLDNHARALVGLGNFQKANEMFAEVKDHLLEQIKTYFLRASDFEKKTYYSEKISPHFELYNSFAIEVSGKLPEVLGEMYNNQLITKAILFNANNKVREKILTSKDDSLIEKFKTWQDQRNYLVKVYKMSEKERASKGLEINILEDKINVLERDLSQQSGDFSKNSDNKIYKWQDVQRGLKKDEASIEIIRIKKYRLELTDTIFYAALILTKKSKLPELVLLKNGNDLETKFSKVYRNSIQFKVSDSITYKQFWKPVADALKKNDIRKVYVCQDGIFNSINLNVLQNPATKRFVYEDLEVQLITNAKDLINRRKYISDLNKGAYLFGFPDYSDDQLNKNEVENLGIDRSTLTGQRFFVDGKILELPGTRTEITAISQLLLDNEIKANERTQQSATEEAMKSIQSPSLLHIATHGFFLENVNSTFAGFDAGNFVKDPLLRSGLLLADAQGAIDRTQIGKNEDGILTAYEAMNLNLDGTELVVLSACETGLGEIRNGEGVYGLQRAFQTAGAKSVLMSLWKVDDTATQELMTSFYKNWLKSGDKRDAFKKAQTTVRKKYPHPYYWGAFVLVGE